MRDGIAPQNFYPQIRRRVLFMRHHGRADGENPPWPGRVRKQRCRGAGRMITIQHGLPVNLAGLAAFIVAHRQAVAFTQNHGFIRAAADKENFGANQDLAQAQPFSTTTSVIVRSATVPVSKLP
jgi:hypothetical protein